VTKRIFSVAEVNELIPQLSGLMGRAMDRYGQARELERRLREERDRIRVSGGGLIDPRDWKARAERLDGLGIEVRAALQAIIELGGAIKDLDLGLVDFPGVIDGETVNLCWKHGEESVGFWHRLDEGFAQRRPLS